MTDRTDPKRPTRTPVIAMQNGCPTLDPRTFGQLIPAGVEHFRAGQNATKCWPYFHALCPRRASDWLAVCTMRGLGTLRMHGPAPPAPTSESSDGSESAHAPAFPGKSKSCTIIGELGNQPCWAPNQRGRIYMNGPPAERNEAWH